MSCDICRCLLNICSTQSTFKACLLLSCLLITTSCAPASLPADRGVLTALELAVDRLRQEIKYPLAKNESVDVIPNDRVNIDINGRALVQFQDKLIVELFRGAEVDIEDVHLEPSGFVLARLQQIAGHSRVNLQAQARQRFILETSYATIRPLSDAVEVAVCHAEGVLTCMVALQGEVEVEAQGQFVTVKGGEATYILADQPPTPPICADLDQVRGWLDALRTSADVGDLGSVVISWAQAPCSQQPDGLAGQSDAAVLSAAQPPEAASTNEVDVNVPPGVVSVPAGQYLVGSTTVDDYHAPAQRVDLPAFWIDGYEVTNEQYKAFVDAVGVAPPVTWIAGQIPAGHEQHPVRGLTWNDANAFCTWAGKRLPTETEWEAAARGPDSSAILFPWGDDPWAGGAASQLSPITTYPVGSQEFNRSPVGVYDLIGNVWEWVGEPYLPIPESMKILHGGRFGLFRDIAYRQLSEPDDARFVELAGVRCAADR